MTGIHTEHASYFWNKEAFVALLLCSAYNKYMWPVKSLINNLQCFLFSLPLCRTHLFLRPAIHCSWTKDKTNFSAKNCDSVKSVNEQRTAIYKPATHYSSLFANNDKIIFSRKNLNFAKWGENTPTHCSSSTPFFANMNSVFWATKNRLWVSSKNHSVERRRCRT